MPSNKDVKEKARKFLGAVSENVESRLNLRVIQTGMWWSTASPGDSKVVIQSAGTTSMSQSGSHEREVFNSIGIGTYYQLHMRDKGFPEQTELEAVISAAGIQPQQITFGYLLALVHAWYGLPEPFNSTHPAGEELLDTIADAVVGNKSTTTYRDALVYVDLGGEPVVLKPGIVLRPVSEDELYELSQEKFPSEPYIIQFSPSDKWTILEIQLEHTIEDGPGISGTIYNIREAIIAGLASAGAVNFMLLPLGMETNFGINATGRSFHWSQLPREVGRGLPRPPSTLSPNTRKTIVDMWPRVKEIMIKGNYLALPLRRLVDGLGRTRLNDKIIDYSIGLEALLTEGERQELEYRFALRGATILQEGGADRHRSFDELKDLYNARSAIVHGASTAKFQLAVISSNGEQLLRNIWQWYYD